MKTIKYPAKKEPSQIHRKATAEGKCIEEQISEILEQGAPIDSSAPPMYTPMADGVLPEFDPRTDKWEIALDATSKFDKSERAKSEFESLGMKEEEKTEPAETETKTE